MQHIKHIWPTVREIADDLGVPYTTAHSWEVRGRIPASYDFALIEAASKRGKALTLIELAEARNVVKSDLAVTHNASHANAIPARQGKAPKKQAGAA